MKKVFLAYDEISIFCAWKIRSKAFLDKKGKILLQALNKRLTSTKQ